MLILRVARLLRQETLDHVALRTGTVKSYLSETETGLKRSVSDRVKRKLVKHFSAPWDVLVRQIDGHKLAAKLLTDATKTKARKAA
jgi:hypothetical protein